MRRFWGLSLAMLTSACGSSAPVFVSLPEIEALTVVIAHRSSDEQPFQLQVFGTDAPVVAEIEAESEAYLLHYDLSANALGLDVEGGTRCTALLPHHKARLESGRFEVFVGALPDALERALVPDPDRCAPCRPVDLFSVNYTEFGSMKAGAWLDSGPLVAHLNGLFRRVDRENSTPIEGCDLHGPGAEMQAIERLGRNRFLVGFSGGPVEVVRFDDEASTCVVETSTSVPILDPSRPYARAAAFGLGLFDGEPEGRYMLTTDGRLYAYRTTGLDLIGTLEMHPIDIERGGAQIARLLRVDGQRALAIIGNNQIAWWTPAGIERVDDVELPFNQFAADGGQRVTSLVIDKTTGRDRLVAGASSGLILTWDEGARRWQTFLNAPQKKEIRAFEFFSDRWLLVIEQGDVVVWHPETGICDEPFRIPLATNSGNCFHRARRGRELVIFDAIGDETRPSGTAWITED